MKLQYLQGNDEIKNYIKQGNSDKYCIILSLFMYVWTLDSLSLSHFPLHLFTDIDSIFHEYTHLYAFSAHAGSFHNHNDTSGKSGRLGLEFMVCLKNRSFQGSCYAWGVH